MTVVHSFLHCSLYTTGMSHLKIKKTSLRVVGMSTEIITEHLLNIS